MRFYTVLLCVVCYYSVYGQVSESLLKREALVRSLEQNVAIKTLNDSIPLYFSDNEIPPAADNSQNGFLRPVYAQQYWSCGQDAGVAYAFTYELNRLKGLPADTSVFQFPAHYTWNFLNQGIYNVGVSYFDSWEIIRKNGHPTMDVFNGDFEDPTDYKRWMNGYEKYLDGMKNRIRDFYGINVGNEAGLMLLKRWLYDHLDNSETGGVANIYIASEQIVYATIPDGLPSQGERIITQFGPYTGHALTIVGYDDSVRYDVNGDGLYTNNLDLNGDGTVDMCDWEIGAYKVVNSYGENWMNHGFSWVMYRTLALPQLQGGIWNNQAHVLVAESDYRPFLTMKLRIHHSNRSAINIKAGVSVNTDASFPDHEIDLPILANQGGYNYMSGVYEEGDTVLEVGFDLNEIRGFVEAGSQFKVFLMVYENDKDGEFEGKVEAFSVYDYSSGEVEFECNENNVEIADDSVTILSVIASAGSSFGLVEDIIILPDTDTFNIKLEATGGTEPYKYSIPFSYEKKEIPFKFPQPDSSWAFCRYDEYVSLGFLFPFYDEFCDSVYVSSNGAIYLNKHAYKYPYHFKDQAYLALNKVIAPFLADMHAVYHADGIWMKTEDSKATFVFITSLFDEPAAANDFRFCAEIFVTGEIVFYFDTIAPTARQWVSGFSLGNGSDYLVNHGSNKSMQKSGFSYMPEKQERSIMLEEDGTVAFYSQARTRNFTVPVRVDDAMGLSTVRDVTFINRSNSVEKQRIRVHPNPCEDYLYLELDETEGSVRVLLYNDLGYLLGQYDYNVLKSGSSVIAIDLSKSSISKSGVYYGHVQMNGGEGAFSFLKK